MSTNPYNSPHKSLVRRSFGKAAHRYAANADFQTSLGHRLLSFSGLLQQPSVRFSRILDAGCGCGLGIAMLEKFFPQSTVCGLDLTENMLAEVSGNRQTVCGDLEHQPFTDSTFELIFCNAAMQWCENPARAIAEFSRVTAAGGTLLIATYGPQTLHELKNSWHRLDSHSHTLTFPNCRQLTTCLEENGFEDIRGHSQLEIVPYASVNALLVSLKSIGAQNCRADRPRGLTSPGKMRAMTEYYAANHQMPDRRIPATYETIFLSARRG